MEIGDLVYVKERLEPDGVRPFLLAEIVARLGRSELMVQPLDPLTCEPIGTLQAAPIGECGPIVNASHRPATKSEWLASWEL